MLENYRQHKMVLLLTPFSPETKGINRISIMKRGERKETKRLIKLIMMGVEGWLKYEWRFTKGVIVLNIKILSKGCFKKRSYDDPESISNKYLTGTGLGVVKRASKGRAADTRGLRSVGGCGEKLYFQIMLALKRGC